MPIARIPLMMSHPSPDLDALLAYFRDGGKPRSDWGVGLEYENVGVYERTGEAVPYSGDEGVEAILDDSPCNSDGNGSWKTATSSGSSRGVVRSASSLAGRWS